jgi:hypothetical protein
MELFERVILDPEANIGKSPKSLDFHVENGENCRHSHLMSLDNCKASYQLMRGVELFREDGMDNFCAFHRARLAKTIVSFHSNRLKPYLSKSRQFYKPVLNISSFSPDFSHISQCSQLFPSVLLIISEHWPSAMNELVQTDDLTEIVSLSKVFPNVLNSGSVLLELARCVSSAKSEFGPSFIRKRTSIFGGSSPSTARGIGKTSPIA